MKRSTHLTGLCIVIATIAAIIVPFALASYFSLNREDNIFYFFPIIDKLQTSLLSGHLPLINYQQNLGETIASNTQAGLFYPIYTLAVFLKIFFHLSVDWLGWIIFSLHLPLMMLGFYFLFQALEVSWEISILGSLLMISGCYINREFALGIFSMPVYASLPWLLVAAIWLQKKEHTTSGLWALSIATAVNIIAGHSQHTCYTALFCSLVVLPAIFYHRNIFYTIKVLLGCFFGLLLSSCSLLPAIYQYIYHANRSATFSMQGFIGYHIGTPSLWGIFSPLLQLPQPSEETIWNRSDFLYLGCHAVPCLVAALLTVLNQRNKFKKKLQPKHIWVASLFFTSIVFLLFSLGHKGGLLPLTYGIPIWSSFRWAYKFSIYNNLGFGILSIVSIDYLIKYTMKKNYLKIIFFCQLIFYIALTCLMNSSYMFTPSGSLIIVSSILFFFFFPFHNRPKNKKIIYIMLFIQSIAMISHEHDRLEESYKNRKNLPLDLYSKTYFGIEKNRRILPLSQHNKNFQKYALHHAPSISGYSSALGFLTPFTDKDFLSIIPLNYMSTASPFWAEHFIGTNFLRSLAIGYYLAQTDDITSLSIIKKKSIPLTLIKQTDDFVIYKDSKSNEMVYLAEDILPSTTKNYIQCLIKNECSSKSILLENQPNKVFLSGLADELEYHFQENGYIDIETSVSSPQLLVVSLINSLQWQAFIDDIPQKILTVNHHIMGLPLTSGKHHVLFKLTIPGFKIGIIISSITCLLMIFLTWKIQQNKKSIKNLGTSHM